MNKKLLLSGLLFVLCLCSAEAAKAYHIAFSYEPRANFAFASTEHVYDFDQSTYDWKFAESQATATIEAWSPLESPSAIAQAIASPIGPGPVATVNLQVNNRTASHSRAYGWADTRGSFTILKEANDLADQVTTTFTLHVTGILNLHAGAYYSYAYNFSVDGVERHSRSGYTGAPPALNDLFITSLVLGVGQPHTFEVSLEGDLNHVTYQLDTAQYQAHLNVQVQNTPLPPSLLLFGSGLLGLGFLSGWRKRRRTD